MAKLGQSKTGTMRVGNATSTGYGIVYADEIIGHRRVNTYSDLANIPAWALYNKAGGDAASTAVGQLWYVTTGDVSHSAGLYQLTAFDGTTRTWKYFKNGADVADSDTTYTFENGTDGSFTVTPKNEKAQKVTIGKVANATHADTATSATNATNAETAKTAESATKATLDSNGNVIISTYATKDSLKDYQPAGSYATLDSTGLIPASLLPSYVDDVVEFSRMVSNITLTPGSTTSIGEVVYSTDDKCFALCTGISSNPKYYNNWVGRENYESDDLVPLAGKIFVNKETNNTYRWSGRELVEISKSVGLGRTSTTAFPGDAGATLESNLDALSKIIVTTTETLTSNSIILGNNNHSIKHFEAATGKAGYLHWTGTAYEWKTPAEFSLNVASANSLGGIKIGYTVNNKNYPVELDTNSKAYVNVPWTDTKYTLPGATSSVMGGVKLASDTPQSVTANAVTNTASRTYGIQKNNAGQLVVNVPWKDTVTTVERIPDDTIKNTFK